MEICARRSSQILEELNFSLFLSSNFKINGQFGFRQRNDLLQSLNLTVSYPFHFVFESFFEGRPSRHLLSKSVRLDPFIEYTFIPSILNGISKRIQIHHHSASSSLSLVSQLESPTRIKKYARLYKFTKSEDTEIIWITTVCSYFILILLGGAYRSCALKISE